MSMRRMTTHNEAGFSLIELLVVALMMGLVMAAVSTLYVSHQRAATVEAEVVDVQQNLRLAMDQIGQDISMAGFLITALTPIGAAVNGGGPNGSDSVTINTASESKVAAAVRVGIPAVALAVNDTLNVGVVASAGSVGGFENTVDANTAKVRVASYQNEPLGVGRTLTVLSVNPTNVGTCGAVAAPCLSLRADLAANGAINAGDLLVKTGIVGAEAFPHTVQYSLAACPAPTPGFCLMRTTAPPPAGGNPMVVATNTTGLQFRYLLTDNTEVDAPTAAQLALVRAVRVTLNGQIVATTAAANGATKTRGLMSVFAIRN